MAGRTGRKTQFTKEDAAKARAIRRYLDYCLANNNGAKKKRRQIDRAKYEAILADPRKSSLVKIKALQTLKESEWKENKEEFLKYAKEWGEANGIEPETWMEMHVPETTLVEAGIVTNAQLIKIRKDRKRPELEDE